MKRVLPLIAIGLFLASISAQTPLYAEAVGWARFRGVNGSGISDDKSIPTEFGESDYNWRVKLPGTGHGSPVVWGKNIFLMSGDKETAERMLTCLSTEDGSTRWTRKFPTQTYHLHKFNNYGTTTPAVDKDRVYTYWVSKDSVKLAAFDHDGKEQWKIDLGPFKSSHGGGTSPMLYKDLVIVANDQMGDSFLVAIDTKTGKQRWKVPRDAVENGTAYAVPCIYQPQGGRPQLVFASRANGMTGIDPETGKAVWELKDLFPLRVVASPVVLGDLVFGTCGQGGGGKRFVAVRPGDGNGNQAKVVYELKKSIPYVPTPLVYNNLLFIINDGTGVASCLDGTSGEVKWQERLGGSFFGSPVCVNGVIYCINKDGDVVVFRAADKFELLHRHPLGELSYATPAVSDGRMYLRTLGHLVSIGD